MRTETTLRCGYYLAVANLMRLFDEPTIAMSVLKEFGQIDLNGIDEQDRAILNELVKTECVSR